MESASVAAHAHAASPPSPPRQPGALPPLPAQTKLAVSFRPLRATGGTQHLSLRFGGMAGAPDASVVLRGRGCVVPVYAVREVIDMKAVLVGSTRAQPFTLTPTLTLP